MGNRSSASATSGHIKPRDKSLVRVAVIGLTETGKSHFVSRVTEGIENIETKRPTCGTYDAELAFGKKRIRLTEMGASVGPTWQHMFGTTDFDCILWFIDSHDSDEDVYAARNMMMQATQDVHCPLCVVYNTGRPRTWRRPIVSKVCIGREEGLARTLYEWAEDGPDCARHAWRPVKWKDLPDVVGTSYLATLYKGVGVIRLCYGNAESVTLLLDWVIAAVTSAMLR